MVMILGYVKSHEDVETCVDMYLLRNDPSFMPAVRVQCINAFYRHVSAGAHVRCTREDGVIRAWMLSRTGISDFTGRKVLQQIFFASDLSGVKAVQSVKMLHEDVMKLAEKLRIYQVISNGSHMDPKNTFVRILGKMGWKVRGYSALWYSSHDPFNMQVRTEGDL
jgi:hypothetical protein